MRLHYDWQIWDIQGGPELCPVNAGEDSTLKNKGMFLYTLT